MKSHPPTALFMSPILVATALIVFSNIILPSRLVTAISYGTEGTLDESFMAKATDAP